MTETPDTTYQPDDLRNAAVLEQVAKIASEQDAPITGNQVAAVIAAWHSIREGDPLGTLRRDPETGAIATRIVANDMHVWHVRVPATGDEYYDQQPTLPWPELG